MRVLKAGQGTWEAAGRSWPRPMWWAPQSPINAPIPANPRIDPESAAVMASIAAGDSKAVAISDYGVPIRVATPTTPRWDLTPAMVGEWGDGTNPFAGRRVPIDPRWLTVPDADGHLVIIDGSIHYNLWKADMSGATPACQWGSIGHPGSSDISEDRAGTSTAAGIARGAGIIREEEIAAGQINHALVFSSDVCRAGGVYRAPAVHTDGRTLRAGIDPAATIIQGSRIQLDPSVAIDPAWPTYVRVVARALQTYGAYCVDNGGAAASFMAELPQTAYWAGGTLRTGSKTYTDAGLTETTRSLAVLPWATKFRVLATWDGS